MGKVRQLSLPGYKLFFHTLEFPWEPPHFNIEPNDGKWKIKVHFMLCTATHLEYVVYRPSNVPKGWNPLQKNEVEELLRQILVHQAELQQEWDEIIRQQWPNGFTRNN